MLKRAVVNAAMMLKKPAASSQQPAAAAAAALKRPASRSGTRAPGTVRLKTDSSWSRVKRELEDKTAELEVKKKELEDRRVDLGEERALREAAEKEVTHANQQLEFSRRQTDVIVEEKVKQVLDDIEHDVCLKCQKLFRKHRSNVES